MDEVVVQMLVADKVVHMVATYEVVWMLVADKMVVVGEAVLVFVAVVYWLVCYLWLCPICFELL